MRCNAGMSADGYTRATGKMSMAIAQNGPGITNMVTPIITAYWNHTPMLLVTPQAANKTIGQGGFQEIKQMAMFEDCVCYQEEVRDPTRIAEVLNRVILKAFRGSAPAQINVPRDYWTQVIDIDLPQIVRIEHPRGGETAHRRGGQAALGGQVPGDPERCRRGAGNAIPASGPWPSGSRRRSAATTSTTTPSRARTRCPAARSATTAPRRPWR